MPALPELQRAFAQAVYAEDMSVTRHVRDGRFPAARLLQVYRNNVFESLTGALKAVYPVVERLVGSGFFSYAADSYIRAYPPASGNLHDFGESLAGYLAGFAPAQGLPYLPDVARLEWAWHRAFHAVDAHGSASAAGDTTPGTEEVEQRKEQLPRMSGAADRAPLPLERLVAVAPADYGTLHFMLHPSAQLLASNYPIWRVWQVNQPDYDGDPSVNLAEGGVRLLVARPRLDVEIENLGAGDDALLRAFAGGRAFGDAAAAAMAAQPDHDLPAALRGYVARGVIVDFS